MCILAENKVERAPTIEVLKRQPREIVLSALLRMAEQTPGYIFNAFVLTYGTLVLAASRDLLLTGLVAMTALGFITAPIAGALSDRIGRRKVYISGCVFVAAFTFVYFALLDTKVPEFIFLAVALSFTPVMTMYGPQAALIAEAFTPRLRYSGASIGYQLASIIAGVTGAVHRYLAVLDLSFRVPDRPLRLFLRGDQHLRGLAASRPNQQGHCARGALRQCLSVASAWQWREGVTRHEPGGIFESVSTRDFSRSCGLRLPATQACFF